MPSRDVTAAMRLAEASWRRDKSNSNVGQKLNKVPKIVFDFLHQNVVTVWNF